MKENSIRRAVREERGGAGDRSSRRRWRRGSSRPPASSARSTTSKVPSIAYGHSDLSARLGVHLHLEHPTFARRRIADACNAHGELVWRSAETEAWRLGCKVLNVPGNDVSTYLDGLKARAARVHARLKSIGVPTP
jgi:hypothetical protein